MTKNICSVYGCGKPIFFTRGMSSEIPLCSFHKRMLMRGYVLQCPKCFSYYEKHFASDKECPECFRKSLRKKETENPKWKIRECLICHEETKNDFLFCKQCYHKYCDKTIVLRVSECSHFEKIEDFYEGKYTCADGHIVKSKIEREIDNYLFNNDIKHAYEKEIDLYDKNGKTHTIKPDFCLFIDDEEVFLEHWGYDESNEEYTNRKNFKLDLYKRNGITLICTQKSDEENIEAVLRRNLRNFKYGKINFLKK